MDISQYEFPEYKTIRSRIQDYSTRIEQLTKAKLIDIETGFLMVRKLGSILDLLERMEMADLIIAARLDMDEKDKPQERGYPDLFGENTN